MQREKTVVGRIVEKLTKSIASRFLEDQFLSEAQAKVILWEITEPTYFNKQRHLN